MFSLEPNETVTAHIEDNVQRRGDELQFQCNATIGPILEALVRGLYITQCGCLTSTAAGGKQRGESTVHKFSGSRAISHAWHGFTRTCLEG